MIENQVFKAASHENIDGWGGKYLLWWFCMLAVAALTIPGFVIARMLFFPITQAEVDANRAAVISAAEGEAKKGSCPLAWQKKTDAQNRITCVLEPRK